MRQALDMVARVAGHPTTVLITGERGTGKEVIAQAIHRASPRAAGPFVAVNCAAIPDTLLESELFGYVKGAFTGAAGDRPGLFEQADGGTLLLDEIGELPLALQAKLLRVLQENEIRRVGDQKTRRVDVRLLVPGTSDLPLVRNLSRIGYRELLRSGVRIFEWDGPMLHAKTIVADGRWTRVGSSNLNPSSLVGNWELDVLIDDQELADAMERQFRLDIARSREVTRRPARGPQRISAALPTVLRREHPEVEAVTHQRSRRERRRRAALAVRALIANARRSIFVPLSVILISLGVLFFVLPTVTAYAFGVLCGWLALSAWREAFRRRGER